eukprot:SAG11_NODE_1272_length_5334_cov_11.636676_1_plen_77_part_00
MNSSHSERVRAGLQSDTIVTIRPSLLSEPNFVSGLERIKSAEHKYGINAYDKDSAKSCKDGWSGTYPSKASCTRLA